MSALPWALVALGGALGSCARYAVGRWLAPAAASSAVGATADATLGGTAHATTGAGLAAFPWATLAVNVVGSFLIGWWLPFARARGAQGEELRLLLVVGGLGGFTTYSAFAAETLDLWRAGAFARAGAYVLASVVCGLLAAAAGAGVHRVLSEP